MEHVVLTGSNENMTSPCCLDVIKTGTPATADRKLYDIPDAPEGTEVNADSDAKCNDDEQVILSYIDRNVIGNDKTFSGPYGMRSCIYCDYTASGRSLSFIEDYIREQVLPEYGNTHTTTTVTSLQTTLFRHEARDVLRNAVNASEHDAVIFTGSGCTGAVHKLINALGLQSPPVVFVGPYEHHSTLLPWKEIGSEIIRIQMTDDGAIDLVHLADKLGFWYKSGRQLIGCMSAASNVTGVLVDVDLITILLHKHGALAMWDYATAGPYVKVDMNPVIISDDQKFVYKDAIFLSTHKFVGGVSTPGILIAKKKLFNNPVPTGCGGGSVFFVRRSGHRYLQEVEMREEGGTPAIVESVRAGLVFQLKEAVTADVIMAKERELCKKALQNWSDVPNLIILGKSDLERLPIFSFLIKHPDTGLFLHHNFTCTLLNDVFGIQARGGCACAGPYAQDLLGIDEKLAKKIEDVLVEDRRLDRTHLRRYREYSDKEILRPGFTRINLPYFMSMEDIEFVLDAVKMVAKHGWKLLPQYMFNPETGEWRHRKHQVFRDRKWLGHITYKTGEMSYRQPPTYSKGNLPTDRQDCLQKAQEIFQDAIKMKAPVSDHSLLFDKESEDLRWFLLPSEAHNWLVTPQKASQVPKKYLPFFPGKQSLSELSKCQSKKPSEFPVVVEQQCEIMGLEIEKQQDYVPFTEEMITTFENLATSDSDDLKHMDPVISCSSQDNSNCSYVPTPTIKTPPEVCLPCLKPTNKDQSKARTLEKRIEPKKSKEMDSGKIKWHPPYKKIFNPTREALEEYTMIKDGDRVMVCVSGGKDSLTLLHTLHQYQFYAKRKGIKFELGAVTVDPQTSSYDPSPLKDYMAALGVPYFYEEQCILEQAANLPYECASICSFCSRMKRGRIYASARRAGYNVLALGQHLDDLAESFLMNSFHNGSLRTMKANYTIREGDLRVIRPLVYVREKELRNFAEEKKLPVISENCPACFEAPKERHRTKQLLAAQELLFPQLFNSLLVAMKPLMRAGVTGANHSNNDDDDNDTNVLAL